MAARVFQELALRDNYIHLVVCRETGAAALVDPSEPSPALRLLEHVPDARLEQIWCTHHHWDHTGGVAALKERFPEARVFGSRYDVEHDRIPSADHGVEDGEIFELGALRVTAEAIPGHTLGHTAFRLDEPRAAFVGDTLFTGGCGRLFEGTPEQMTESLFGVIGAWPDDTLVYCGHEYTESNLRFARSVDPDNPDLAERIAETAELRKAGRSTVPSTLGMERRTNPFLRCDSPAIRSALGLPEAPRAHCFGALRERKDKA